MPITNVPISPSPQTIASFGMDDPRGLQSNRKPQSPTTLFGNPSTFTAAANTQASDYDTIMKQYDDLAKSFSTNPLTTTPVSYKPITPQTAAYTQSPDVTSSLGSLKGLADTGGYSAADIANIRERDISPIRSIYATDQAEMDRQRTLQGGYSPSFNATTASMARDEANKISDVTTAANAGIAQNVAANKLAAAPAYASAASSANAAQTEADRHNADIINQINQANAQLATQTGEFNTQEKLLADQISRSGALGAIQGKQSLYGTTPALTKTFGDQVMQATGAGQSQQELNNRKLQTVSGLATPRGY